MYVVGVSAARGVTGADPTRAGPWFEAVSKHFDDVAPAMRRCVIMVDGKPVVFFQFDTDDAPYVVSTGFDRGVTLEVPWLSGTGIRSARYGDLHAMIAARRALPDVNVSNGSLRVRRVPGVGSADATVEWEGRFELYVLMRCGPEVTFVDDLCRVTIDANGKSQELPARLCSASKSAIDGACNVTVRGEGKVRVEIEARGEECIIPTGSSMSIAFVMRQAGDGRPSWRVGNYGRCPGRPRTPVRGRPFSLGTG